MAEYGAEAGMASTRPGDSGGAAFEGPEGPITCDYRNCESTRVTMDSAGRLRCDHHAIDPDHRASVIQACREESREQLRRDDCDGL